jgi:aspartyl-tRNA(Asn)/glutamyl-tRNA(Gln) amidotransferase subunit A
VNDILEAGRALRSKKVSSVELTTEALTSISRLEGKLNSFLTVTGELAQDQARRADAELARGIDRGPLHGIPIAIKDVYETKGVRTTCGSKLFENNIPERDAAVVEKLQAAGAVSVGKTHMHELAYGVTSNNPHFGPVHNPWDLDRIPGGSSGGSGAAVAAGTVFMATGSDTGGSIRMPAAYCGTVGLKPTFGRVSRYGVLPLDFSLDHMGPLTRTVRDAAIVLNAIAGYDPRDDSSSREPVKDYVPAERAQIDGVRIGVPENFYLERADPDVVAAVRSAAQTAAYLRAQLVPVKVPDIAALNTVGRIILLVEAAACMERFLDRRADFGADVLALLDQGGLVAGTDYVNAQRMRRVLRDEFRVLFRSIDCLFTPTVPIGAPKIGQTTIDICGREEDVRLASTKFLRGINVLGWPALSVPCGLTSGGLPIGLQILGRPFEEDLILRVGAALEDATEHHKRRPVL